MKAGIIGLGYVGLPLAVAIAEEGHEVVCVDTDQRKLAALERGESYIEDIDSERLAAVSGRLHPTSRYADLASVEVVVMAVPTPLTENREPDLGHLVGSATSLAGVLQQGQLVVLESTTYPGTTRERLVPLLEESGLAAGRDFHVAYSPERIDPGRTDWTLRNTPKVVGGLTDACRERAVAFYRTVCDEIVEVTAPEEAELTKLLENVFRSVNIALVNELAILCDRMGIDIWEVVDAATTKPYGFMSFRPGPGMGGHCLPVDPFYLAWKAREYDMPTAFVELAGEVNQKMPYFCVERVARALNGHSKPVRGSRVAVVGVSYKPGVGDLRESPALRIMRLLADDGADLVYHDDTVPDLPDFGLRTEPLDAALEGADVVVIVTAHPGLDIDLILSRAPLVVDFRGVTRGKEAPNLVRLLSELVGVGVVGLGYWGPNLARNFDRLPGADLRWICDTSEERRERWSASFPTARPAAELAELLADPSLDAVVLATHVPTHADLAVQVLEAGKHCFVEKPLAQSAADAERVVEAATAAGRVLMVGHLLEYHPGVEKLRDLVSSGALGDVRYLYSNRLNLGQLRADENALWSLGAHDVSVVLRLVDEDPVECQAVGESYMRAGVEDVVFGYLRFPSGIAAHLHLSWLDPHKERRFTVVGSKQMATFDDMELEEKVKVYDKGFDQSFESYGEYIARSGDVSSPSISNEEPLRIECRHFLERVRDGDVPRSGPHSGLRVVRVLEALQESLDRSSRAAAL